MTAPVLTSSRPRDVRLTAAGVVIAAVGVGLLVLSGAAMFIPLTAGADPKSGVLYVASPALATLGLLALAQLRRDMRLLAEGRSVTARVIAQRARDRSHGAEHVAIEYEFRLLNGATVRCRANISRKVSAPTR